MKIDPQIPAGGELQNDRVTNTTSGGTSAQGASKAAGGTVAPAEDTVQLSGRHAEVQQLTAQAAALPDVRAEKIAPLQAKVQSGNYQPNSQKVADALLAEQSGKAAKA
jgi:flagellar biosynthesis anti-sigma factor FlgM